MKQLIALLTLIAVQTSTSAAGPLTGDNDNLGAAIEAEKKEIALLQDGADTMLKLRCQDELADLEAEIAKMDARKTPPSQQPVLREKLRIITLRREFVASPDSSCLLELGEDR